jgi:DNA-directed RNA polymerase
MGKISQRELDLESYERGRSRYYRNVRRAMDKGVESESNWGARMVESAILPFSDRLKTVMETDTGVGAVLLKSLGLAPEVMAMIAFQSLLDGCSKNKTFTRGCIEAAKAVQAEAIAKLLRKESPEKFETYNMWIHLRGTQRKSKDIKRIAAYTHPEIVEKFAWTDEESLKAGYVLAMTACEATGLLERVTYKRSARHTVAALAMTKEAWAYAHKAMRHAETLRPVKLPMVVPPRKWVNPDDGGYEQGLGDSLVRGSSKVAKASHTKEAMPLVYDAINVIQHTPFRVNQGVLAAALALMESRSPIGDLDVHEETPMPERPPEADLKTRNLDQFLTLRRYYMDCTRIAENNRRISSRRLGVIQTINLAVKFASEKDLRFFHAAALDFRGRFYCQATGLSHQGNDLQRGLIEFGLGHPVPPKSEAMQAWLRHGAAVLGRKGTLEERAGVMASMIRSGEIDAIAKDPLSTVHLWGKADEPFSYLAWCLDMPLVRAGKPSHLMVAVDGSCNGLQVLSLLLKDEVGAAAVNVIPSDRPSDIYQMVADRTMVRIRDAARLGENFAREWEALGVSRSMVKRPVMCLPYSISQRSAMLYLKEAYLENHRDGPWMDPSKPCGFLIRKVWPSIGEIVVKGTQFLDWARKAGQVIVNAGIHPMWVTPDGFTVQQSYYSYEPSKVKTTLGKQAHIWQIRNQTAKIDRRKHVNGIVPNLVHSLDATAARMTARRLVAAKIPDMAFVHDSYLVHAAFQPVLARELREAWIDTFEGDPLKDWMRQIEAQLPKGFTLPEPPGYGNLDITQLRNSKYFFA